MKSSSFCCISYKQTPAEQSLSTQECKWERQVLSYYFLIYKGRTETWGRKRQISKTADALGTSKALSVVASSETLGNFIQGNSGEDFKRKKKIKPQLPSCSFHRSVLFLD